MAYGGRVRRPRAARRYIVLLLATAALASGSLALPPASAAGAPNEAPTSLAFEPDEINRTPLGGPAGDLRPGHAGTPALHSLGKPGEVTELRTERSQTFLKDDGTFETIFHGTPVHYQDDGGAWQPIDNSLVPSSDPAHAARNKANRFVASLPAQLEHTPVRVAAGERSVEFSLRGANGGPKVDKATATYAEALPGVTLVYTVTNSGLKEELVLAGPHAPASYEFTLRLSPGLSATESASGIALVDEAGHTWARFSPPFVHDASYSTSGAATGFSNQAVSLRLEAGSPDPVLRLAVDPAWLADPSRVWPVTIDPTVSFIWGHDTYINPVYPDWNYSSNASLAVGGAASYRSLYQTDKDMGAFFSEPVQVIGAAVDLYATNDSTGKAPGPVGIHAVTADWEETQVTWNQRRAGVPWVTAGGDFSAQPASVNDNITGPPGLRRWWVTPVVQAWADGERSDRGFLLKYQGNEAAGALITFCSEQHGSCPQNTPRLVVQWEPIQAMRAPFGYERFALGEHRQASVNVASGNLTIQERDVHVSGTGLDAVVSRSYVSRAPYIGSAGSRWRMWPQSEERLYIGTDGNLRWHGGPEEFLQFSRNADGSYLSPHGHGSTMTKEPDGSYTLLLHADGTRYHFGSSGYIADVTDRNGNKITFGYTYEAATNEWYLVSMTDTQGRVTTFERAGEHQVTRVVDPAGRTHTYGYDTTVALRPLLTTYTDPAGKVTRYGYDRNNGDYLTRLTDPLGNVTTFGYSRINRGDAGSSFWDSTLLLTRLTRVTDPVTGSGPTWSFDYSVPFQTKVTDPRGNPTTYFFDRKGRVTKTVDAKGQPASASYTSNSYVASVTDQMSATSAFTHDTRDNLTSATSPTGAKAQWAYDDAAHPYYPSSATSAQGNRVAYTYDAPGNLTSAQNGLAAENQFRANYNPNGTVASSTDALGNVTTYGYDSAGNLTSLNRPLGVGNRTLSYDGLSRLTSVTDAKGQKTTFAYDPLDRLTQRTYVDGSSITYTYDAGGNLTRRDNSAEGATTFAYDALGRPISKSINLATYTLSYDAAGNIAAAGDFGGSVTYAYDSLNLLTTLTEPDGRITRFTNDAAGRRTSTAYPNGVIQTMAYDASGRQTRITGKNSAGTVLTDFAYAYTNPTTGSDAGLRYRMTDAAGAVTNYSYDALDRLTEARSSTATYAYGYDGNSNRLSQTINGARTDYTYDAANRLTQAAATTYSYDLNGNLTGSSAGMALSYNAKDQTTRVQMPGLLGPSLDMGYVDADQTERSRAGGTSFESGFVGIAVIREALLLNTHQTRDNRGNLVALRRDGGQYYLFDGLGSVVAVTDGSGKVRNRYAYDPYGNRISSGTSEQVGNPWGFAGGYRDTTGLIKFGTRYYDPTLGRWTQRDPVPSELPYAYAGDNPVNFVDPSGMASLWEKAQAAFISGGAAALVVAIPGPGPTLAAAAGGCAYEALIAYYDDKPAADIFLKCLEGGAVGLVAGATASALTRAFGTLVSRL